MRLAIVAAWCLLLVGVSAGQATPSVKKSLCTVAGQVVQQPGGTPLKKVMVSLAPAQGISQGISMDDGGQEQYAAVTDAEGHFQIGGVQPGEYHITLERNGFVATHHRSRAYSSPSLSLTAGQEITNLLLPMLPAGVIQGRVFDEDGDPAPNVSVFVFSAGGSGGPSSATTNDLGDYRIGGLSGGEYFVMAQAERGPIEASSKPTEPRVYAPTFYPGTTDKRQATKLEVHPGDEVGANFNLVSTRTYDIRGSVSGVPGLTAQSASEGRPASVMLGAIDDSMEQHFQGMILPNGTFEINGVVPGTYRAIINARSGPTWQTLRTSQTIEIRSADVDGLQLFPEPPSQIRGHFRMDSNQPPDWTQLNIQIDPDDREGSNGSIVGKVSKDGSFNVQVPSGNYHAVVTSNTNVEGWRDFIVKEVVLNGKDVGDSGFSVAGGLTSLEIVASGQGSTIEGNVVDEDGKPVADVPVVCIPDASRRTRHDIYQQIQTDRQGHFAMRGLNPGEYQIFTLDDPADDITDSDFVSAHEALGQSVKLDPGQRKGVVLKLAPDSQP